MSDTHRPVPRLIPARMVNEGVYCPRLLYLEWVQGEFEDNAYTVEGTAVHERVDGGGGRVPAPEEKERRPYEARSVWLSSETLGVTAKIDVVEGVGGEVSVVEYKRGAVPDVPEGAYLPERVQVCVHVLLLREHGYTVRSVEIYYATSKRRVPIVIDAALVQASLRAIAEARRVCEAKTLPPPLVGNPKCVRCSLAGICLPDETLILLGKQETPPRPLYPAADDKVPLHVQEQGAKIGLRGDCLLVRSRDGEETSVRIVHTSGVCVYGSVQVSTQAMRELLMNNIPLSFFTTGGWYCGRTVTADSKNVAVRLAQVHAFSNVETALRLARALVASKIRNSRTLLRRNGSGVSDLVLAKLDRAAQAAEKARGLDVLLGIEGAAAVVYFEQFTKMLKNACGFELAHRNRRPPRDPVNALLSLAYAVLAKDFSNALLHCGLDPLIGFYHQPRFGRPSLALDLMEEFRPVVADSVVVTAINTGVVTPRDFIRSAGAVALTQGARRSFLAVYERRMDQEVTHPLFGYRTSYRRVLEVQVRLLSRVLLGEFVDYPHFKVR